MKLRYNTKKQEWEVCFPQCGSESGWSQWGTISRLAALGFIEDGWSFERV